MTTILTPLHPLLTTAKHLSHTHTHTIQKEGQTDILETLAEQFKWCVCESLLNRPFATVLF